MRSAPKKTDMPDVQRVTSRGRVCSISWVSAVLLAAIVLWGMVIAPGWLVRLEALEQQAVVENAKLQAELEHLRSPNASEPPAQTPPRLQQVDLEVLQPLGAPGGAAPAPAVLLEVPHAGASAAEPAREVGEVPGVDVAEGGGVDGGVVGGGAVPEAGGRGGEGGGGEREGRGGGGGAGGAGAGREENGDGGGEGGLKSLDSVDPGAGAIIGLDSGSGSELAGGVIIGEEESGKWMVADHREALSPHLVDLGGGKFAITGGGGAGSVAGGGGGVGAGGGSGGDTALAGYPADGSLEDPPRPAAGTQVAHPVTL